MSSRSAAIVLAQAIGAKRLPIDDWDSRVEALRRGAEAIGTLGVLAAAHRQQLIDFEAAVAGLRQTNFYLSDDLLVAVEYGLVTTLRPSRYG